MKKRKINFVYLINALAAIGALIYVFYSCNTFMNKRTVTLKDEQLSKKQDEAKGYYRDSLLFYIKIENHKGIEYALKRGAKQDEIDDALHYVALSSNNDVKSAQLLIKYGANLERRAFRHHSTPIFSALNNLKVAKVFLEKGGNINVQDRRGYTPLFDAVSDINVNAVKFLLENGANVKLGNNYNEYPLTIAVKRENLVIVKLLVKYGADPELAGVIEKNHVYLWNDKKRKEIQDYLKNYVKNKSKIAHQNIKKAF